MTCHFHSRGRNNHPLPSIPYLDMDWSWHTVGASLTVQKQDGTPERNMEASVFLASYVDAFCCLFDLCKFQNSFFFKKTAVLLVWLLSLLHLLRCDAPLPLSVNLWASATLPTRCLVETTWRKPETTHGPEPPVRGCDQAKEHGFHSWGTRDSAPNLRQNACFAEWGWWGACILANKYKNTKRLEQLVTWSSPLLFDIRRNTSVNRDVYISTSSESDTLSVYTSIDPNQMTKQSWANHQSKFDK